MGRTRDHSATDHREPDWDERYASAPQVWSGKPDGALVTEVAGLQPGRVLDVGCGEGADAVWLAQRSWSVTALDVSEVALRRAQQAAEQHGVQVEWVHARVQDAQLPASGFDLVSVHYPALLRTPDHAAERALLSAVAPGGTLLLVTHADVDATQARAHGFDPDDYVEHSQVAALLDAWEVEVDERRARDVPESGGGVQHTHDVVLRARRLR